MPDRPRDSRLWRDFAHTTSVLIASALARHEQQRGGAQSNPRPTLFTFEALAAASEDASAFEALDFQAEGGTMSVAIEARNDDIRVTLQAKGYAALRSCAGREARLVSRNGAVSYAFRFSDRGAGVCVLADTPEIREGLRDFRIEIAQAQ